MNLPSDLATIHEQVELAMSHHTDGALSPTMLDGLVSSMSSFVDAYKGGAPQTCPLTGQPTTRMAEVDGIQMGAETAVGYLSGDASYVQIVDRAKLASPAPVSAPASFETEPIADMGLLSPENQGIETPPPPAPAVPSVPAVTPTVQGFLQKKASQSAAAATPPPPPPPTPTEETDMASLIVQEMEAQMQGSQESIHTDDGTVFYDSMADLVRQYTQWPEEQSRAFLANLATVRKHFQEWSQDPAWVQRQMAFSMARTPQEIEDPIIGEQMDQRVGRDLGDPSMFMPETMRVLLASATAVFLESMRRMERTQQDLAEQGLV